MLGFLRQTTNWHHERRVEGVGRVEKVIEVIEVIRQEGGF
jgi:hypothetical protein